LFESGERRSKENKLWVPKGGATNKRKGGHTG